MIEQMNSEDSFQQFEHDKLIQIDATGSSLEELATEVIFLFLDIDET